MNGWKEEERINELIMYFGPVVKLKNLTGRKGEMMKRGKED